jgi:hypothetical protein
LAFNGGAHEIDALKCALSSFRRVEGLDWHRIIEIQGIVTAGAESAKREPNGRHYYLTA